MGELAIIFGVIGIIIIVGQFFLYKNPTDNKMFLLNILLALVISLISFSSLPSNYLLQRIIALAIGALSFVALMLRHTDEKNITLSNILLTLSIVGGAIYLMF